MSAHLWSSSCSSVGLKALSGVAPPHTDVPWGCPSGGYPARARTRLEHWGPFLGVCRGRGTAQRGGEWSRQTGTMEAGERFGPCSPEDQLTGLGPQNDSLSSAVRLLAMASGSPHRVPVVYRCFSCVQPRLPPLSSSFSVSSDRGRGYSLIAWQLTGI